MNWKKLWSLKINERLKIYLWRVASECLPWFSQGGLIVDLSGCLRHIKSAFTDFSTCQTPLPHFESTPGHGHHSEKANSLFEDWSYLLTDAAWTSERSTLAGIRNQPNMPISHLWFSKAETGSPLQAEAKAVLLAITLTHDHGWRKIWIRFDALLLVDTIIFLPHSPWEIKNIISDIVRLLALFWDWKCTWIPRSDNSQAHDLSQYGNKSNFPSFCMFEGYPDSIVPLIP
ncbi:hypothetical protein CRG98_018044 [Punica granatum]|uniref:RNase H type-1 domain-containing protein n=1 Tax=Punica granatum TaxID=22663 RepID=A0A2I0JYY4_PUNGR|nr:hypothetical protein CRG98_018044 [Punica granatum]